MIHEQNLIDFESLKNHFLRENKANKEIQIAKRRLSKWFLKN